jgi:hypothetical protein
MTDLTSPAWETVQTTMHQHMSFIFGELFKLSVRAFGVHFVKFRYRLSDLKCRCSVVGSYGCVVANVFYSLLKW